jgi:hypothetical protein
MVRIIGSTWRDVPDPSPPPTATEEQIERDARRFDETVSDHLERQAQDSTDPMHAAMLRVIARSFGNRSKR